jgi:hypothetical protein
MSAAAKQQKLEQLLTSGRESVPAQYSAIIKRIADLSESEIATLRAARQDRDKGIVSDVIWFDHTPEVLAILDRIAAVPGERK